MWLVPLVEMVTCKPLCSLFALFPNTWANNWEEGLTLFMVLVHTFPWSGRPGGTGQLTGKECRDCREGGNRDVEGRKEREERREEERG